MLNKALRLLRVFHDLKQKDLAEKLGVSKSYISEIESGKKTPTLALLERYTEVFEVPTSSILFLAENLDCDREKMVTFVPSKMLALLNWVKQSRHTHIK